MTLLHGYQVWVTSKRYLYKPIVHFKCLYVYKGITSCPRHQEGYKGNITCIEDKACFTWGYHVTSYPHPSRAQRNQEKETTRKKDSQPSGKKE